jgi:ribose-phosphate pyrophosphokinase
MSCDDKNYNIYNQYGNNLMSPVGPIGIIPLIGSAEFSSKVNSFLVQRRTEYMELRPEVNEIYPGFMRQDYRIQVSNVRFSSGEGKAVINNTVRGHAIFIISVVMNYYCR